MSLSSGTKLGPYEIQAPLGAGGMGEVYRARDTRLERTVAVKVLPDHLSCDPKSKRRFEREARTISSLNHPHICALYDIGTEDGIDFLVMEYLEGQTLADRLQRGALSIEEVLEIGIEIADALDKAHRQGIVHRDLKPSNIMVTKSGAKLMDFGLAMPEQAAFIGSASAGTPTLSNRLTVEGTIVGTFQYMAPEQLEGKEADARSARKEGHAVSATTQLYCGCGGRKSAVLRQTDAFGRTTAVGNPSDPRGPLTHNLKRRTVEA
jgi:serine/threonine protein kinase